MPKYNFGEVSGNVNIVEHGTQVNIDLGEDNRPIICIDFDGVIHAYDKPWKGPDIIESGIVPGFLDWAAEAQEYFRLVIYSARSRTTAGIHAMQDWLRKRMLEWYDERDNQGHFKHSPTVQFLFEYAYEKPRAFLTIDDRAIQFKGDWSALGPKKLLAFKPWNRRG